MSVLARADGENFVIESNNTDDNADPINDVHTFNDKLMVLDFRWWGDSVNVDIHDAGDSNHKVDAYDNSTDTSGLILAGTYFDVDDALAIALTGTTYKGYRLILGPWKDFYRGS